MEGKRFPLLRALALAAGLSCAAAAFSGCRTVVEAMGYTVVDEDLEKVCVARDDATQRYLQETEPLLGQHFQGMQLLEMQDLAKTLSRVSRKERELVCGSSAKDDDGQGDG